MNDLQVVWPKGWIAEEFERAGCAVSRHTGMDVVEQTGPIWWATEHATKSMAAGYRTTLTAPNGCFLAQLPKWAVNRNIRWSTPQREAQNSDVRFVKSANSKIVGPGDVGRAMVANVDDWVRACTALGVPGSTPIIISDPVIFSEEWRCWYDGMRVTEMSLYQKDGFIWDEWPVIDPPKEYRAFGEDIGKLVQEACTIDIGLIDGKLSVVEFNPVWSSGMYTSDFREIYQAIKGGYERAKIGQGTKWVPDPWLQSKFK